MGIVKISEPLHEHLRQASAALSRSINAQAEHWLKLGMLAELCPALSYHQLVQRLILAEQAGGLDLLQLAAEMAPAAPAVQPNAARVRPAARRNLRGAQ